MVWFPDAGSHTLPVVHGMEVSSALQSQLQKRVFGVPFWRAATESRRLPLDG